MSRSRTKKVVSNVTFIFPFTDSPNLDDKQPMTCLKEQKQTLLNKGLRQTNYTVLILVIKVKDTSRFVIGLLHIAVNMQINFFRCGMVYGLSIRPKKVKQKVFFFTKMVNRSYFQLKVTLTCTNFIINDAVRNCESFKKDFIKIHPRIFEL